MLHENGINRIVMYMKRLPESPDIEARRQQSIEDSKRFWQHNKLNEQVPKTPISQLLHLTFVPIEVSLSLINTEVIADNASDNSFVPSEDLL